jgi:hypothetical protein
MRRIIFIILLMPISTCLFAQDGWHIQPVPMQTRWAKEVSPSNALKEYPRPQMMRANWTNLNGRWDYAITKQDSPAPTTYDGNILVPYPLESALSGVKKSLQPDQLLWYKRSFHQPALKTGERLLLHFGAVDWQATIFVNGKQVAQHQGGYTAFSADITDALEDGPNELLVKVYDPSDEGIGPHGKQVLNPQGIYYTPTSGIWQTVWLEVVPAVHIENLQLTPDIDKGVLNLRVNASGDGYTIEAVASANGKTVGKLSCSAGAANPLEIPGAHLWSPTDPFLYDLTIKLRKDGKVIDEVKSYFGMRKISIQKDIKGIDRIFLNNKYTYNLGVLDQGFWPDGLYTAPTDEALAFDIKAIKAMGFNTIRKHMKVEPARWYYWADKLGMMVWQDMVNPNQSLPEGSKPEFEKESADILAQLHNNPCITTWVLFNEKWGQYDQQRLTDWIKATDPSRVVNGHTGEILYVNGQLRSPSPDAYVDADLTDVHSYPDPMMPVKQPGKAQVEGEFGGIGVSIFGHEWEPIKGWGYIQVSPAQLEGKYHIMVDQLKFLEEQGLSGSIYTQPYDVEGEENGLMSYDRDIVKIPFAEMRKINSVLVPDPGPLPVIMAKDADKNDEAAKYAGELDEYLRGWRDPAFLERLAEMAVRLNDKVSSKAIADSYVLALKAPLTNRQVWLVSQFTKSTSDPGFALMNSDLAPFRQALGKQQANAVMVAMISKGLITPQLNANPPDWQAIAAQMRPYGALGEMAYLQSRSNNDLIREDWVDYVPTAKQYLKKYGEEIPDKEKQLMEQFIAQHQN